MIKKLLFAFMIITSTGSSLYACCKSKTTEQVHQEMVTRILKTRTLITTENYKQQHCQITLFMDQLDQATTSSLDSVGIAGFGDLVRRLITLAGISGNRDQDKCRELFQTLYTQAFTPEQKDALIEHCRCFRREKARREEAAKGARIVIATEEHKQQ